MVLRIWYLFQVAWKNIEERLKKIFFFIVIVFKYQTNKNPILSLFLFLFFSYSKPAWSYHVGEQGDIFFIEPSHKVSLHKKNMPPTGIYQGNENQTVKNMGSKQNVDCISADSQSNESSNCSLSVDSLKSQNNVSNKKDIFLLPMPCDDKENGEISDVELFEKLFGIVLCSYNLKLPKGNSVNNNNNTQVLNDRKLIVQKVVMGSQAQRSQKIHKGQYCIIFFVYWNIIYIHY